MISDVELGRLKGLSEQEAAQKASQDGYNELPSSKPRNVLAIAVEVIREPMFLLLLAGGAIYFLLGDAQEGVILLCFVFLIIAITFYQEQKTERALEALRDLSSPRALVIRDGKRTRIAGRDVVQGDLVVLAEGDRVPADAKVVWNVNLRADEALLTGESMPVGKTTWDGKTEIGHPGGDDLPFIYSGTLIVSGQGIAEVYATGLKTEIGKIGKALSTIETEDTLLQRDTRRLVRNLTIVGGVLCVIVVLAYGLTRGNWLQGMLSGISLAMALAPEEFPVVLTIFLALGAWRISRKNVLTRRVPAIEMLGAATVLCVDKTGTLTMNRMAVRQIFADSTEYDVPEHDATPIPEQFHEVVEFSILASQRDPFDPMEAAFKQFGEEHLSNTEHLHNDWSLVQEYPLSRELLALSHVWEAPQGGEYVVAAKGAPEAIADLCHLDVQQLDAISHQVEVMANQGLRVLAVAKAYFKHADHLPGQQHDFEFKFVGLIALADPVRSTVPAAINECYRAGVRVVMITGDYPATAQSIARQIGLHPVDQVITGPELALIDDTELQERVKTVSIFARMVPEQKLRLVNALKANGEIVAMTGDGVNDAPALKAANIGIAMGKRGTDVAREASSLVLLDDDFSSIVEAIKLGRRIFDNLHKAMVYILAVHVPIAGMSLIPVILKWPLMLLPVHIVFLEMIIDPACSIVFEAEPEEEDVMNRPPRNAKEPLFSRRMILLSLFQGVSVLLVVFIVFSIALMRGQGDLDARALAFTTLIVANLGLIITNRSWTHSFLSILKKPNKALRWVVLGAIVGLGLVLYVPFLNGLFRFNPLHLDDIVISLSAGIVSICGFEVLKRILPRFESTVTKSNKAEILKSGTL